MSVELFDYEGNCEVCDAHFHEHDAANMTECAHLLVKDMVDMPNGDEFMAKFVRLIDFARPRLG